MENPSKKANRFDESRNSRPKALAEMRAKGDKPPQPSEALKERLLAKAKARSGAPYGGAPSLQLVGDSVFDGKAMEINGNQWKNNGNQWKSMEINGKSMEINGILTFGALSSSLRPVGGEGAAAHGGSRGAAAAALQGAASQGAREGASGVVDRSAP